jgi:hypothetical protein
VPYAHEATACVADAATTNARRKREAIADQQQGQGRRKEGKKRDIGKQRREANEYAEMMPVEG